METMPDDPQISESTMAAQLCAASLGTQCTILDRTFSAIEPTFDATMRGASSICELVKAVTQGAERCAVARQDGARRAVQLGAAYFYACHAELVEGIVPVQLDGNIAGYVLIGPVFLAPADALLTDKIVERLSCFQIPEGTVKTEIKLIPVVDAERFKRCLNLLSELVSAPSAPFDTALREADASEAMDDDPGDVTPTEYSHRHRRGPTRGPGKERFILARARLGNLAEMRHDVGELLLRAADGHRSADIVRAAALQTVSALWRAALDKEGSNLRIDSRNLALSRLFKAQTHRDILDWTVAVARRLARDSAGASCETRARLKKAQTYARRHVTKKLTCKDVAQTVGMTARELGRTLQDHLGMSFRLFLSMERLSVACRLLRESDLTATEIAAKTGFSDQSNFTKTFVKFEGITPIQYRVNSARTASRLKLGVR
jgi:AraC-like DNA-binding protein/ligand-binding sensor protein